MSVNLIQQDVKRIMLKHKTAAVSASIISEEKAKEIANDLKCHCCYFRNRNVYDFAFSEFAQPITKQEKLTYKVIR